VLSWMKPTKVLSKPIIRRLIIDTKKKALTV
jgi:hypothetical protein